MSVYSKFLSLVGGVPRTIDLSQNSLAVQGLQVNAATGGGFITQLAHASTTSYTISWPAAQAGGSDYVLANDGTGNLTWIPSASGSVTDVTASAPLSSSGGATPNITIAQATTSTDGYLSSTDWNTFNNKQAAGNYITALTGDVVASGPGSVSSTIQNNVVSNAKLAQMASHTIKGNASGSTANAADLSATQVTAMLNQFTSTLQGLVPGSGGGTTNFLRADGSWAAPVGSVTSVALDDGSSTPIYSISGSPVTSAGTLTFTLNTQNANLVFAGPTTGSAAEPSFRSLVSDDIPDLSATYVTQSEVGAVNGVASLDGSGKVPIAQLPNAVMEFQGSWDASTNTPSLADGTGGAGDVYRVSVAAAGPIVGLDDPSMVNFQVGDFVIYNGSVWQRSPAADGVTSVNGMQGAVTVDAINQLTGDVTAGPASGSQSVVATIASGAVTASKLGSVTDGVTLDQAASGSKLEVKTGGISATQLASGAVTAAKLGTVTDGVTLDQSGSGSTLEIKSGGVGTTQLASAAVTAAKLGSVTDGITLDQSGSGSTLEIKSGGVDTTQLASNAVTADKVNSDVFDQDSITGGAGSAAVVQHAPLLSKPLNAGQSFDANTSYIVRWGMDDLSESADEVFAADYDTTTNDEFWAIGIAQSGTSVIAGQPIKVVMKGSYAIGSGDTAFNASDVGKPVYLTASGAFSTTPPSAASQAVFKIGVVESTSSIFVDGMMIAVN